MMPAHMIWLVALVAWPAPAGPKCSMVLPMAASIGLRALEGRGVAARHDGERALLRAFDAAAHRRIEERAPTRGEESSAQRAVSALTVEQSMTSAPLRKTGRQAFDDRAHVRIGGDADHDRVERRGEVGERGGDGAAELGGERLRFVGAAIPDRLRAGRHDGDFSPWEHPWHRDPQSRRAS